MTSRPICHDIILRLFFDLYKYLLTILGLGANSSDCRHLRCQLARICQGDTCSSLRKFYSQKNPSKLGAFFVSVAIFDIAFYYYDFLLKKITGLTLRGMSLAPCPYHQFSLALSSSVALLSLRFAGFFILLSGSRFHWFYRLCLFLLFGLFLLTFGSHFSLELSSLFL